MGFSFRFYWLVFSWLEGEIVKRALNFEKNIADHITIMLLATYVGVLVQLLTHPGLHIRVVYLMLGLWLADRLNSRVDEPGVLRSLRPGNDVEFTLLIHSTSDKPSDTYGGNS